MIIYLRVQWTNCEVFISNCKYKMVSKLYNKYKIIWDHGDINFYSEYILLRNLWKMIQQSFLLFLDGFIFILQYNQKGLLSKWKFVASYFTVRWNELENFPLFCSLSSLISHIINPHIFLYNEKFSLRKIPKLSLSIFLF